MDLISMANFAWVFIGIKTPTKRPSSSRARPRTWAASSAHYAASTRMASTCWPASSSVDTDTLDTFDRRRHFIMDSGIQAAMVGLLTALPHAVVPAPGQEGRLIERADDTDNTRPGTNIVLKNMDYDDMVAAYQRLYRSLLTDFGIAGRIRNKLRWMNAPVYRGEPCA